MLAKFLGVKVSEVQRRPTSAAGAKKTSRGSRVRFVYPRAGGKFQVIAHGVYKGTFDTKDEASAAARAYGSKLGDTPRMRARPLKYDMVSVTKELCKNFVDWIPADLDHLIGFRQEHPAFAASSGPLYLMAALGKEIRTCI